MQNDEGKINVFVVDDDKGDQKLITTSLQCQELSLNLKVFSSAEEALEYLEHSKTELEQFPVPSLILLDLNMPGMGGKGFLQQIKQDEQLCSIPVVVVTTSDAETDIEESYELKAAGYIKKASSQTEFNDEIEKLTKYWFATSMIANL